MIKRLFIAAVLATLTTTAHAGVTEQALARCTAAAQQASPGADVTHRKIVEGGRNTLISFWVKDAGGKRSYDCKVSARGELTAAFVNTADKTAVAAAD